MFTLLYVNLRAQGVAVGMGEWLAFLRGVERGLAVDLDSLYQLGRTVLVHSVARYDAYDQAFSATFAGVELPPQLSEALQSWLKEARETLGERVQIDLDPEALRKQFLERLAEQKEHHDGGNRWIGTGGTSPFGRGGFHPSGISVGGAGGKGAVRSADARKYRSYRTDVVFDLRQIEVALRRLRGFVRDGAHLELDIEGTIDATAKNAGELEVVVRPPRRPNTRVILMMDVGGSMDPYAQAMSQLFSAAKRSTHWRELRTYYFHNCVYGRVYKDARLADAVKISQLFTETDRKYKLIVVGDALMAPWELMSVSGWHEDEGVEGVMWMMRLREHFPSAAWLNPEQPSSWWQSTIDVLRRVFPMYPLTLEGLGDAVHQLTKVRVA